MKIIAIVAVILALASARHTYEDFAAALEQPSIEMIVDNLLNGLDLP